MIWKVTLALMIGRSFKDSKVSHLPEGYWYFCGQKAYKILPGKWRGICTTGYVVPTITKHQTLPQRIRIRNPRNLTGWVRGAVNLFLPPIGIQLNTNYLGILSNYTEFLFNNTIKALKDLTEEVNQSDRFVCK